MSWCQSTLVVAVVPLEVELRVVEHDVGPDEIRRHVGKHAGCDLPEQLVLLVGPLQAADSRRLGTMAGREVEDAAGSALAATPFDELVDDGTDSRDLVGAEQRIEREIAVGEIVFPLLLAEDACGLGQYCFRRHRFELPIERRVGYIGSISIVPTTKCSEGRTSRFTPRCRPSAVAGR